MWIAEIPVWHLGGCTCACLQRPISARHVTQLPMAPLFSFSSYSLVSTYTSKEHCEGEIPQIQEQDPSFRPSHLLEFNIQQGIKHLTDSKEFLYFNADTLPTLIAFCTMLM